MEGEKEMEDEENSRRRSRFVWVRVVKVGDEIGSVAKFIGRKPGSFVVGAFVSEPLN